MKSNRISLVAFAAAFSHMAIAEVGFNAVNETLSALKDTSNLSFRAQTTGQVFMSLTKPSCSSTAPASLRGQAGTMISAWICKANSVITTSFQTHFKPTISEMRSPETTTGHLITRSPITAA